MKRNIIMFFIVNMIIIRLHAQEIGNPFFNPHIITLSSKIEGGLRGTQDYLEQSNHISYKLLSSNRHSFKIRASEKAILPGVFTNHFTQTLIAGSLGFEYNFKIFPKYGGLSLFTDIGYGIPGFFLLTGIGVGDYFTNGFFLQVEYLHNSHIQTDIDLCFLIARYFSIRGNLALYIETEENFTSKTPLLFKIGGIPGFYIPKYARFDFGAGVTINDHLAFGFYATFQITTQIPFYK